MDTNGKAVATNGTPAPSVLAMKEPFVQRDGKTIDIASVMIALDSTDKALLYSFREEYEKHFETRISLPDLLSDLLSRGINAQRNSIKWGSVNKETREVQKAASADVADLITGKPVTDELKAKAFDILQKAQEKAMAIKQAARKRR